MVASDFLYGSESEQPSQKKSTQAVRESMSLITLVATQSYLRGAKPSPARRGIWLSGYGPSCTSDCVTNNQYSERLVVPDTVVDDIPASAFPENREEMLGSVKGKKSMVQKQIHALEGRLASIQKAAVDCETALRDAREELGSLESYSDNHDEVKKAQKLRRRRRMERMARGELGDGTSEEDSETDEFADEKLQYLLEQHDDEW